jgi:hypothetical protein
LSGRNVVGMNNLPLTSSELKAARSEVFLEPLESNTRNLSAFPLG